MSYPEFNLTKVYSKKYVSMWCEVYKQYHNELSALYDSDDAVAAAVATGMIAFVNASGMGMTGIITWDEKSAPAMEDFKTFADKSAVAAKPTYTAPAGDRAPTQAQGPAQGGYAKKPYDGPKELKGAISEPQIDLINKFLNSNHDGVREKAQSMLELLGVASPEELSKQDASDIIGECKAMQPAKKAYGGYRN